MFGSYYGIIRESDSLEHHGVKGMKWGKHLFGLKFGSNVKVGMTDTATGDKSPAKPGDAKAHMADFFAKRDARAKAAAEVSAAKRKAAAEAAAAEEAKKASKKKSSGSKKKSSSKASSEDEDEKEETKTEETKTEQPKKEEPVQKAEVSVANTNAAVQKPVNQFNAIRNQRIDDQQGSGAATTRSVSQNNVDKTKNLLKMVKMPDDPSDDEIRSIWETARENGYGEVQAQMAVDTVMIKRAEKKIKDLESQYSYTTRGDAKKQEEIKKQIDEWQKEKAESEEYLRKAIKTGELQWH